MKDGCSFCEYEGPSPILCDYGDALVFEPINPVTPGHVLVVPIFHVEDSASPAMLGRVMSLAGRWVTEHGVGPCNFIASRGEEATQTVRHLHVHVIPRRKGDGLALPWSNQNA